MEDLKKSKVNELDHRELNRNLEIFLLDGEIGKGLPILLKRGTIIKNLIQQFIRQKEQEMGAEEVISPVLANPAIYERSGHLEHYGEYIFPAIEKENELFQLRPMTCPHHCIVYRARIHSYRELPIWICEHSILHRFESSGSLKGLERARWMELSDNHVFCTRQQIKEVFQRCFNFIRSIFEKFEIEIDRFVCSLHDNTQDNKYHKNEVLWASAEESLNNALEETGVEFIRLQGEAAFYGPKLDIEVKAKDGKRITFATIQLDFVLPEKFGLSYVDEDGSEQTPVIIHYSSIGSYQRFISILLEQTQGKLPFWLAPCQLVILPLFGKEDEDTVLDYCNDLLDSIRTSIRSEIWKEKHLASRIKKLYQLKNPSYIVIGKNEVTSEEFKLELPFQKESLFVRRGDLLSTLEKISK